MDRLEDVINTFFEKNIDDITPETREFYLTQLISDLRKEGMTESLFEDVAGRIMFCLDDEFIEEEYNMLYQTILANEINMVMRNVYRDIDKGADEVFTVERQVDDGDVYHQDDEIDAGEIPVPEVKFNEEFDKLIGINNE